MKYFNRLFVVWGGVLVLMGLLLVGSHVFAQGSEATLELSIPSSVQSGAIFTASWTAASMRSVTKFGGVTGWAGDASPPRSGSVTLTAPNVTSNTNKTFYIYGTGTDNSRLYKNASMTIIAPPQSAPTVSVSSSPTSMDDGSSSTISWSSSNATSCSASGDWSGSKSTSGSTSVSPSNESNTNTETFTYTLTCTGGGGSASDSATVSVSPPAPTVRLSADKVNITRGETVRLSWLSTDATSCESPWTSSTQPDDVENVNPQQSTVFSIACVNYGGRNTAQDSIAITVQDPVPTASISVSNSNPSYQQVISVTGSCEGASSGNVVGPGDFSFNLPGNGSGTQSTSAETDGTYIATCTNDAGSATARTSVDVQDPPANSGVVNISESSVTVNEGESFSISWSSSNMTGSLSKSASPSMSGWSGTDTANTSDSQTLTAPSLNRTTSYTLTISGTGEDGGTVSDSVTVTVLAAATINVTHQSSSDTNRESHTIMPGVVLNRDLNRGNSTSYTVYPSANGSSYTFSAPAAFNGPYITLNGWEYNSNTKTFSLSGGDVMNITYYYQDPAPTDATLNVTNSCPSTVSYTLSGTGSPSSTSDSVTSNGTDSHTITINGSSDSYSISPTAPSGYNVSVSPSSHTVRAGDTESFAISCSNLTATLRIDSDGSTNYRVVNSSNSTIVDDFVVWDGVNTHSVTLEGSSETLTLIPDPQDGYEFDVTNDKSSSTNGAVSVDGGDDISFYIDKRGLAGSCSFTGTSGGTTSNNLTVDSGASVALNWSGTNLSFTTAQDDEPNDGVWGTKAVTTRGGSETITMPTVAAGQSITKTYALLCGFRDGTRETKNVSITAEGEPLPVTIEVISNKATTFSIPGVASNVSLGANELYSTEISGSDSGTTYVISYADDPAYSRAVSASVDGVYAGTSSATASNGETLRYTLTYTAFEAPTVTISADPASLDTPGNTTLTWSSTDADSCTASGDWSGSKSTSGSQNIGVGSGSKTFTLTCTNDYGEGEDTVVVSVGEELTATISASADEVPENGSVDLTWSSTGADSCWAQGSWSGTKATSGTETINGSGEGYSNFYIYCEDDEGNTENDVVTVYFYEVTECNDGVDNDGDGDIDGADSNCDDGDGDSESNPYECADGIDNDSDGDIDLSDSSCSSASDDDELNPQPQYSMTVSPSTITLGATDPQSESTNILITSIDGYSEDVDISVAFVGASPTGTTLVYPASVTAGSAGQLYVEATEPLESAEYTIEVTSSGEMQDGGTLVIRRYVTLEVEGGDDPRFEEF